MADLLMAVRRDRGGELEAEPVVVEVHAGEVRLELDDGVALTLDRTELQALLADRDLPASEAA